MLKKELTPLHLSDVTIDGPFWAQRIKINRERTIPRLYKIFGEKGQIDALKPGWEPPKVLLLRFFGYGGIYKWIEAVSYSITTHPDAKLESVIDDLVEQIAKRQQPDGYTPGSYRNTEPEKRFRMSLQSLGGGLSGGVLDSAIAHFQATGKRTFLDVACRSANLIDSLFGNEPGKKRGYPEHEGIELSLMRLYQITGEKRYANLAKFFVDERGQKPHYYDREIIEQGEDPNHFWAGTYQYNQSHKPVREQDKVVGHAVRATYLYTAMADVAAEFGDEGLRVALDRLWDNLTSKRMYITGGIGSQHKNEGFSEDYDLPNETAYTETCASIGLLFWAHRMLQFECDGRYADVMERVLYNGLISGVSLDGEQFFYQNPLTSLGGTRRRDWFDCPCCPPNLIRTLASLGNYVYSASETDAIVHLYVGGTARLHVVGLTVGLRVDTKYPWDGKVMVTVEPETPACFGLKLRIPNWCREFSLKVNGEEVKSPKLERGYLRIEREWKAGDNAELNLSMPVELVKAHPEVRENTGCVAIQRGPLVYCIEQIDNNVPPYLKKIPLKDRSLFNRVPLEHIIIPEDAKLGAHFEPDLLDGVMVIDGNALHDAEWDDQLYCQVSGQQKPFEIKAIPYYAWNNRGRGEMKVWLRTDN